MVPNTIERDVLIDAPVERVWSLLTDAGFLGRWFGDGSPARVDLRPGGLLVLDHGVHGVIPARIERVEAPRLLAWRWSQGAAGEEPTEADATLVEFTLAGADEGRATRLRMVESGFATLGLPPDEVGVRHRANSLNWPAKLAEVRDRAERLPV